MNHLEIFSSDNPLDRPIVLHDVPSHFQKLGFKRPHIATVYRWVSKRRLETIRIGGTRYTTPRMIASMCECNVRPKAAEFSTSRQLDAERYLAAEGLE